MSRYQVKDESVLGHGCCFGATVIDSAATGDYNVVCECLDQPLAKKIADAMNAAEWRPLATAPRDGTHVELRGDSGYKRYPYRVMIARYEVERAAHHPNDTQEQKDRYAWRTVQGDHCTDDGPMPTHWRPAT